MLPEGIKFTQRDGYITPPCLVIQSYLLIPITTITITITTITTTTT